jgi:hypothetical protein
MVRILSWKGNSYKFVDEAMLGDKKKLEKRRY